MEIPKGFAAGRAAALYGEATRATPGPAQAAAPYAALSRGLQDAGGAAFDIATREQYKATEDLYAVQTTVARAKLASLVAGEMATFNARTDLIAPEELAEAEERVRASLVDVPMPPRLRSTIDSVVKEHMASLLPEVAKRNARIVESQASAELMGDVSDALAARDYPLTRTLIGIAEESLAEGKSLVTPAQVGVMKRMLVGSEGTDAVIAAYAKGGPTAAKAAADAVLKSNEISSVEAENITGTLQALARGLDAEAAEAQVGRMYDIRSRILDGIPDESGTLQFLHRADVEPLLEKGAFEPDQEFMIREALRVQEAGDAAEAKRGLLFADAMANGNKLAWTNDPSAKAHAGEFAAAKLPNMLNVPITQWTPQQSATLSHMIDVNYVPPQVAATLETGQTSNTLSDTQAGYEMANFLAQRHPNLYGSMTPGQVGFYDALRAQTKSMVSADAVATLREQSRELAKNKPTLDLMWEQEKINKADLAGTLLNNLQKDPHFRDVDIGDAVLTPEVRQLNYQLVRQQFDLNGGNLAAAQTSAAFQLRNVVRLSNFNGAPEMMVASPETQPGSTTPMPTGIFQAQLNDSIATAPIASQPPPRTRALLESITGTPNVDYRVVSVDTFDGNGAPVFAVYYRANNMPVMLNTGEQLHWSPDYAAAQAVARTQGAAVISDEKNFHDYVVRKLAEDPNWNPIGPRAVGMYLQVKAEPHANR